MVHKFQKSYQTPKSLSQGVSIQDSGFDSQIESKKKSSVAKQLMCLHLYMHMYVLYLFIIFMLDLVSLDTKFILIFSTKSYNHKRPWIKLKAINRVGAPSQWTTLRWCMVPSSLFEASYVMSDLLTAFGALQGTYIPKYTRTYYVNKYIKISSVQICW